MRCARVWRAEQDRKAESQTQVCISDTAKRRGFCKPRVSHFSHHKTLFPMVPRRDI